MVSEMWSWLADGVHKWCVGPASMASHLPCNVYPTWGRCLCHWCGGWSGSSRVDSSWSTSCHVTSQRPSSQDARLRCCVWVPGTCGKYRFWCYFRSHLLYSFRNIFSFILLKIWFNFGWLAGVTAMLFTFRPSNRRFESRSSKKQKSGVSEWL